MKDLWDLDEVIIRDGALVCPVCNQAAGGSLHQKAVEVFFRNSEDALVGEHCVISRDCTQVDGQMVGNPSTRRDGLIVYFSCECGACCALIIAQHKGTTHIGWGVKVAGPPDDVSEQLELSWKVVLRYLRPPPLPVEEQ